MGSLVDPDRMLTKLGKLEEYLRGLAEKQDCGKSYLEERACQSELVG